MAVAKDHGISKEIAEKAYQDNEVAKAKAEAPHLASYIDKQAGVGHNSKTNYGGITGAHLRQYIECIERLEEEKKVIAEDMKEVFGEAKANGFDVKIMRKIISIRKLDAADREEQEALMDLYMQALGMTPIEKAIEEAQ